MGHRAMPTVSWSVGHMGMGRPTNFRSGSSSLAIGGGSGRRSGLVFSAGLGATGTDMGRLAFVGHAAGWRTGRNQTDAYRGAVSPGGPRRPRPGVGDRPCLGSCASGSRTGRFKDCGTRGPSLDGASLCCSPAKISALTITACSPKSERLGIGIGQPLAEAKALLPKAVFLPADIAADLSALGQLALDCQRFSPMVGLEEGAHPESLLCEVSGCTHLWHGEKPFLQAVRGYWRERGYQIQLALAGTLGAAWALAHTATFSLVPAGNEEKALSDLSVAALRLPSDAVERLETLGLLTIGDVLRLPRETLASRFGGILPQRIDQALGLLPETFVCERLREPLSAVREWETPIEDRLALALVCRQMVRELLSMAERHGMGLQELEGELRTETGPVTIDIRLVEPTRDEGHLAQLAELQLERLTWSGGVVAVRWAVLRLGRLEQAQGSLVWRRSPNECLAGIQHSDRSTQQPLGGGGRAARGAPSRLTAGACGPTRSVDECRILRRQTGSR